MRIIVLAFLILVMLMHVFSKTIIYTAFLINQDYIAKNLCENRNAPEKKCCGKCQLEKRMTGEAQKQDAQLPSLLKSVDEITLMNSEVSAIRVKPFLINSFLFPEPIEVSHYTFVNRIFRPPCIA
jgi:hypothetical protein